MYFNTQYERRRYELTAVGADGRNQTLLRTGGGGGALVVTRLSAHSGEGGGGGRSSSKALITSGCCDAHVTLSCAGQIFELLRREWSSRNSLTSSPIHGTALIE